MPGFLSKGEAGTRGGGQNESCSSQSYETSAREHSTFLQSWRQDHDYLPTAVNISNSQITQFIENLNRAGRSGGAIYSCVKRTQILNDISPLARWATQTVSRSTRHCHLPVSDERKAQCPLWVRSGRSDDRRGCPLSAISGTDYRLVWAIGAGVDLASTLFCAVCRGVRFAPKPTFCRADRA